MTKDFGYSFIEEGRKEEGRKIFVAFLILTFNLNLPCNKVEVLLEGAQADCVELSHSRNWLAHSAGLSIIYCLTQLFLHKEEQ